MPAKPIIFGNTQASGDQELAGASPLAVNVLMDGKGAVRRRPGISAWSLFPATQEPDPVIGISTFQGDVYFVTSGARRIWRLAMATGVLHNLSTGGSSTFLAGTERPVFASTPWRLVIAGGNLPQKVETVGFTATTGRLGGNPPNSKYVAALASRLFTDDQSGASSTGQVRFSSTGNAGTQEWDALNFTSAEARPDPIVAVAENGNELFAFGSTSLQVYQPDPTVIIAPGRAINYGCAAGHSVISSTNKLSWLSEQREFVTSDARSVQGISDPLAATLDRITTVSDCYGFRWMADQFDCLCWQFPTDGRTFVAQAGGGWAQWHGWTNSIGHTLFPISSHHFWPEENLHLVGLADGRIAQLDSAAGTDLGATIKAEVLTGFENRGTDAWKSCDMVRFIFKRGQAAVGSVEPQVLLSWRDGLGAFCTPLRMGLGLVGDPIIAIERRTLGMYRARQWKLEFSDAADFVLARAEETFSFGGNN